MSDSDGSSSHPNGIKFNVDVKSVPLAPIFLKIEKTWDVIHVLHAYALKLNMGLIILSAVGSVCNVMLPLTSKIGYDEGVYQIMSMSGRIVPRKIGGIAGDVNLVMADVHGTTFGGMVMSLIAETIVEVTVCPFYYDRSVSKPFDFDPPLIFGNPFIRSTSNLIPNDPSSSDQGSNDPSSSDLSS